MSDVTCREVFAALAGTWTLDRSLEPGRRSAAELDLRATIGTMRGTATFTPVGPRMLAYREEGELRLAGGDALAATREYRWLLVADDDTADDRIDVRFAADRWSGGVMHSLRLDPTGTARDVHHCDADDYTGTYAFTPPDLVVITMDVRGPTKDYTTRTTLRRLGSPRAANSPGPGPQGSSASRPARWSS